MSPSGERGTSAIRRFAQQSRVGANQASFCQAGDVNDGRFVVGLRRELSRLKARHLKSVSFRGLDVPLTRSGMNEVVAMSFIRGTYELPEITAVEQLVRHGDRILEVGCGLGVVTALAARAAGTGRVLSYEANPALIEDTRKFLSSQNVTNADVVNAVLVPDVEKKNV